MKLALEFAALLIAFLCFSSAMKAFLHLRQHEWRLSQRRRVHADNTNQENQMFDRVA